LLGSSPHARSRRGFTIIELLVALVLLDVGLIALVGMVAASTRDADALRRDVAALRLASVRLERAASVGCGATGIGVARAGTGVTEWYAEVIGPNETRVIGDSVVAATTRGPRVTVVRTGARC
jgi:type II secretory pathway pseudopilin PulG